MSCSRCRRARTADCRAGGGRLRRYASACSRRSRRRSAKESLRSKTPRIRFVHPLARFHLLRASAGVEAPRGTPCARLPPYPTSRSARVTSRSQRKSRTHAIAAELEHAAEQAAGRGAPMAAAELYELAAELTPDDGPDSRRRRLLAARFLRLAGDVDRAFAVLRELSRRGALGRRAWRRPLRAGTHAARHDGGAGRAVQRGARRGRRRRCSRVSNPRRAGGSSSARSRRVGSARLHPGGPRARGAYG